MASRNGARRHKGSTSYKTRGWPDLHPYALETFKYWQAARPVSFVYFIREGDDGPIKIGTARDPLKRVLMLQCGNPRELRVARLIVGHANTEKHLHDFWASACVRGEWFGQGREQEILDSATRIADAQIAADRDAGSLEPPAWTGLMHSVFLRSLFAKPESEAA